MNEEITTQLQQLFNQEDSELYFTIGHERFGQGNALSIGPKDREDLISKGKRFFFDTSDRLKKEICGSSLIQRYIKESQLDNKVQIAAGLADILLSRYSITLACSLSVLIIRGGLTEFCAH